MSTKTYIFQGLKLLLLAFLSISFVSCSDEEGEITYYNTYIDGYVTDYNTGEPIQGIVFGIHYYYDLSGDWGYGWSYVENACVTDSKGYYRVRVPKTINGKKAISLTFQPHNTNEYGFQFKELYYKSDNLSTKNTRINITPVANGYLKVIVPIKDGVRLYAYTNITYERPVKTPSLISLDTINNTKEFLFSVPATEGEFRHLINNFSNGPEYTFTVEMPKDTVLVNLTNK